MFKRGRLGDRVYERGGNVLMYIFVQWERKFWNWTKIDNGHLIVTKFCSLFLNEFVIKSIDIIHFIVDVDKEHKIY